MHLHIEHPDDGDRYTPLRYAGPRLLVIPLIWPFVALALHTPLPAVIFFGFFLFIPPALFLGLSWLMGRRPERYLVRILFLLETVVGIVALLLF